MFFFFRFVFCVSVCLRHSRKEGHRRRRREEGGVCGTERLAVVMCKSDITNICKLTYKSESQFFHIVRFRNENNSTNIQ